MSSKFYLLIFSVLLLSGCKDTARHNAITKIVLARGGCYGTCPVEVITIDSSLTCYYEGVHNTGYEGLYTAKISRGLWDSINIKFEKIRFRELDSSYIGSVDDEATALKIFHDNKMKYIRSQSSMLPEGLEAVVSFIGKTPEKVKLEPTTSMNGFDFNILSSLYGPVEIPGRLQEQNGLK
ncbi:hypothetical protein HYN59_12775 [Flavobacterium album]|uniref:DUF6438 domain-containing protein n=1 Tax=Flavobacterium album TaxID=2175091 RepID=A0A2S1QZY1_9FLAO|nr:DUF6438 domain-containing protein [Flavobacterium album]AWH85925.1 hypothetical protein HYN59_12775 [Flavobacterium album]